MVVPPALAPGAQYRLVFVTGGYITATSTDINDYNNFVTNQVTSTALATALTAANLTTTWRAIGSTSTVDARDNTGTNPSSTGVPIYLIDGNLVANNNGDLWDGTILTPIDLTPNGRIWDGLVWSGTSINGIRDPQYPLGNKYPDPTDAPVVLGESTSSNYNVPPPEEARVSSLFFGGFSSLQVSGSIVRLVPTKSLTDVGRTRLRTLITQ